MSQENPGRPSSLSQESKDIVISISGPAHKSVRELVKDIEGQRGQTKSKSLVHRELIKQDLKAFHVIQKPLITERNREDRLAYFVISRDRGTLMISFIWHGVMSSSSGRFVPPILRMIEFGSGLLRTLQMMNITAKFLNILTELDYFCCSLLAD